MIGFRGASRYYDDRYKDGFALECQALRAVREGMGLDNVKIMIPFCRTVEECKKVLKEMAKHGLNRGSNGMEVYLMCELPSNVISMEAFAEHVDGFSIGSNDLTQLVLGVDRDSEILATLFDERDESVAKAIEQAVTQAKRLNKKIGICGQAPSDYPEIARLLVDLGIDSMSLNEDAVIKTILTVAKQELLPVSRSKMGEARQENVSPRSDNIKLESGRSENPKADAKSESLKPDSRGQKTQGGPRRQS